MLQSEKLEGQGMTVLLIEDDRRLAELVCTYLEHAGYQVVLTETGEEGIAAMQQVRPQVILLDLMLPFC
jgi:DNA-binding response OmpR family regulator